MTTITQAENVELTSRSGDDGVEQYQSHYKSLDRAAVNDWARMCYVINDFRWLHGHWPTRFRMSASQFNSVRELFSPQEFAKITAKIDFITDASAYKAEDERGASCGYQQEFLRAADWLGVNPKRCQNGETEPVVALLISLD